MGQKMGKEIFEFMMDLNLMPQMSENVSKVDLNFYSQTSWLPRSSLHVESNYFYFVSGLNYPKK
jgi:hypothetical protein